MTLRKRYTLLVIGVILFFIIAPTAILGIQGYFYDWQNKRFLRTGILVAKTEPKDASLIVEGGGTVRRRKSSGTIRFLFPGDYKITLERDGFFSIEKRLTIRGGLVTWIDDSLGKKFLLSANLRPYEEKLEYETPEQPRFSNFIYTFEINPDNHKQMSLVSQHVNDPLNKSIIFSNIHYTENAQIIPGGSGLIFLLLNQTLYQVNTGLEYVAEGVHFATWEPSVNKLAYGNSNEINLYDPWQASSLQRQLVTRTSEKGGSYCFTPDIGYLLRTYGNVIRAVELDGRDRRNIFEIIKSDDTLEIVSCDRAGEKVVIREGVKFKFYKLRP